MTVEAASSSSPSEGKPSLSRACGLLIAFGIGFSIMNSELAAARLLAPYYGTSTAVWALLLATVLLSLAMGNVLGAWLSHGRHIRRILTAALLASAALMAALPLLAPRSFADSLRSEQPELLVAAWAIVCVVWLGLFALPVLLLGAASPLLFRLVAMAPASARLTRDPVTLSGLLSASTTAGSLFGTLGAGLLFIPRLGTTRTLHVGALVLLASALGTLATRRWVAGVSLSMLAVCGTFAGRNIGHVGAGNLIFQGESAYNHVTVVETNGERQLRVNDGYAVQSFAYLDGRLPARSVWSYYALAPSFGTAATPRRVLLLGLGGGTTVRLYRELYPEARLTGVELDRTLTEAGERFLGTDLRGVDVAYEDARTFVNRSVRQKKDGYWDVIILDAFQFPYVPFQLTTREFFGELEALLARGGVLMVNAGRFGEHREVVEAISATLVDAFAYVQRADVANQSNTILIATLHSPHEARGIAGLQLSTAARATLERLARLSAAVVPAPLQRGIPLTDDLAPVEHLTDAIVWAFVRGAIDHAR